MGDELICDIYDRDLYSLRCPEELNQFVMTKVSAAGFELTRKFTSQHDGDNRRTRFRQTTSWQQQFTSENL